VGRLVREATFLMHFRRAPPLPPFRLARSGGPSWRCPFLWPRLSVRCPTCCGMSRWTPTQVRGLRGGPCPPPPCNRYLPAHRPAAAPFLPLFLSLPCCRCLCPGDCAKIVLLSLPPPTFEFRACGAGFGSLPFLSPLPQPSPPPPLVRAYPRGGVCSNCNRVARDRTLHLTQWALTFYRVSRRNRVGACTPCLRASAGTTSLRAAASGLSHFSFSLYMALLLLFVTCFLWAGARHDAGKHRRGSLASALASMSAQSGPQPVAPGPAAAATGNPERAPAAPMLSWDSKQAAHPEGGPASGSAAAVAAGAGAEGAPTGWPKAAEGSGADAEPMTLNPLWGRSAGGRGEGGSCTPANAPPPGDAAACAHAVPVGPPGWVGGAAAGALDASTPVPELAARSPLLGRNSIPELPPTAWCVPWGRCAGKVDVCVCVGGGGAGSAGFFQRGGPGPGQTPHCFVPLRTQACLLRTRTRSRAYPCSVSRGMRVRFAVQATCEGGSAAAIHGSGTALVGRRVRCLEALGWGPLSFRVCPPPGMEALCGSGFGWGVVGIAFLCFVANPASFVCFVL
jgi:hypothetical protein